ncbi:hypothetical protein [Aminobacter sp. AP02]|uniref:hypothetical protein n=1 Tax=Aminobacter sp. AP02 TaxID=2135737 RepID=UPI000D7A0DCF|nr:hypothetical protein [Aminobacter sp. AP02]PWK67553.1 hypothetical protein C8K44_112107 [Aminobacter sp. AP02]
MLNPMTDDIRPLAAYAAAFGFILMMVFAAVTFGDSEIVLPEIAAMAVALWAWREKGWLRQPEKIFFVPSITAIIGFAVNLSDLSFTVKILLVLCLMLIAMRAIGSNLAPALATGFLPVVTNATHYSFLIAIFVTTFALMLGVMLFKLNRGVPRDAPVKYKYMLVYLAIHLVWIAITVLAGYPHMAIIPPITVVVYESLQMPMYMRKMALKQTAVLTLSALIGTVLFLAVENTLLVAVIDLALIYGLLHLFEARIPAAYAFPFLPFVFPAEFVPQLPVGAFVVSVFFFSLVLAYKTYERKQMANVPAMA